MDLYPDTKILVFALSTREHYRSPLYSTNEVFAGPDVKTEIGENGYVSINTPVGEFDIQSIIGQLPSSQKPELIVIKADATARIFPRNLSKETVNVLVLGNTQHMVLPIQMMLKYACSEPFHTIATDHKAHHLHFFKEAGLSNIHWLPGLNFKLLQRELNPEPSIPLSFVGQVGRFHPYRKMILSELGSYYPLHIGQASQEVAADIYANSEMTLNISLNGDMNLRVFEALGAGGFLLTDFLAPESGLEHLFKPGIHLDTFSCIDDLKEKVKYYSEHPELCEVIRKQGQLEILKNHNPAKKAMELVDLALRGITNPLYETSFDERHLAVQGADLDQRLPVYEFIQEQHLNNLRVNVHLPKNFPAGYSLDFRDLPRLYLYEFDALPNEIHADTISGVDILIVGNGSLEDWISVILNHSWYAVVIEDKALQDKVKRLGYVSDKHYKNCFLRSEKAGELCDLYQRNPEKILLEQEFDGKGNSVDVFLETRSLEEFIASGDSVTSTGMALQYARKADELGLEEKQEFFLMEAIGLDRSNYQAYLDYAGLLFKQNRYVESIICLKEAFRLNDLPQKLKNMMLQFEANPEFNDQLLDIYRDRVGENPIPPTPYKLKVLVVTNLLPPQEMGGFGPMVWEFCDMLIKRGHDIAILCADVPHLEKTASSEHKRMEGSIQRKLELFGGWKGDGFVVDGDINYINEVCIYNHNYILDTVDHFQPDVCLVGNLDFMGTSFLHKLTDQTVPIVHVLGNMIPGFSVEDTPKSSLYCLAGCSHWLNEKIADQGYPIQRYAVIYPGAALGSYFKPFSPKLDKLRICFAGLLRPYKGAHILMQALGLLKRIGVPFTCEFAGDTTTPEFINLIKKMASDGGYQNQIVFTGFLGKSELAKLYGRCNVMVMPSVFEEPFGRSQIEAMAAGLCVVTSGTGGTQEIIRHGVNGVVFKSEDVKDLARWLYVLSGDRKLWARLALQGQSDAYNFTTLNSIINMENEFYDMLQLEGNA